MPVSPAISPVAFPLSRAARQNYDFDAPTFSAFERARELAAKINAARDLETQPQRSVRSGRLAAAALLDEIFAHVIAQYVLQIEGEALQSAPGFLDANLGEIEAGALFEALRLHFSPPTAWKDRPETIEHLLRLHLANGNPALRTFAEIFDAAPLENANYNQAMNALSLYFQTLPPFGARNQSLLDFLWEPIRQHPDSIEAQLQWILAEWDEFIAPFLSRLLTHLDLIREEEKPTFFGPGPAQILSYKSGAGAVGMDEYEAFTLDRDWMPGVVLIAKQTYVWLDQLSKKYGVEVKRLDQIPDAELDEMAARGITGLWMIGLCQRSTASRKVKRITGNPDALSSAYSLYSYEIAREIGGPEALENLKSRAIARGIRMASDMVPNHMAIDSQWIIERPDYFLSLPSQPFPNASFNGPDLCDDERIGIFLEDGYYSKTEASVVFKRVDYGTGDTRFVYHGNDGTAIPWNDTAQLDYLKPDVREAVMQTILDVARQFPIIRFDAAMTLAKRHIHRLWFPAPGSGGDIPSRAGRGVSAEEFDALMPQEFWREVVERVAREVPDTLLLAEAFWMMEGYFVRTLGMHRVYNSAFMNMLRDGKNAEYRQTLKNTLEFDPAILGRFVNFMNNPDEETAREQFGKGDKYFGVCTLLATLPGLPMIGHGQIEGYGEKYGMEYPRAYWNETPDAGFIKHHQTAIFPLLHKRYLFAGSDNFTLYDVWNGDGFVDEDVFAYSNRAGNERALVVFNNRNTAASGWIKSSVGFAQKNLDGSKTPMQRELGASLGAHQDALKWMVFRESNSNLEFLRASREICENGLFVELGAYGHQVFLDWREVSDESGLYARLAAMLRGGGVPNVERAVKEMLLAPVHAPFSALCDPKLWAQVLGVKIENEDESNEIAATETATENAALSTKNEEVASAATKIASISTKNQATEVVATKNEELRAPLDELEARFAAFVRAANRFTGDHADEKMLVQATREKLEIALESDLDANLEGGEKALLIAYALLGDIGVLGAAPGQTTLREMRARGARLVDEWLLGDTLGETLASFTGSEEIADAVPTLKIWLRQIPIRATDKNATLNGVSSSDSSAADANAARATAGAASPFAVLNALLSDDDARAMLGVNTFERVIYFRGEGWDNLKTRLQLGAAFDDAELPLENLDLAARNSEFRVVKWMENARVKPDSVQPDSIEPVPTLA